MTRHRYALLWLAGVLLLASGCATVGPGSDSGAGNGSGQSGAPAPVSAGVTVSPATVSVRAAETKQFAATLQGGGSASFSRSVNGIAGGDSVVGTISSSGLYTAPATTRPIPRAGSIAAKTTAAS